jgi:chemotaxis protein MotB
MTRRKKTRGHSGKSGQERWLLTYSDLITLLVIFFVVMYALSNVDAQKFKAMAYSLAASMGGGAQSVVLDYPGATFAPGVSGSYLEENLGTQEELSDLNSLERLREKLQRYIDEHGLYGKVTVNMEERGVVLSFRDIALFPLGSAELTPEAREMIKKIGQILIEVPNHVRVEGHTDDLPISTRQYPSNWELSVARSTRVVQELLQELDFTPRRLSASGYGEYRPRVPNDSIDNRQQNRRVDMVILRSRFGAAEPVPLPQAAGAEMH